MDSLYGNDRKLSDFDDSGVTSYFLLDQEDVFQTSSMFQELTSDGKDQQRSLPNERTSSPELFSWCPEIKLSTDQYADHDWFNSLLEDPVLNDKMITDAVQSPRITSEHSYSINNDQSLNSSIGALCKIDDFGKDIDVDIFDSNSGALDLSQKTYNPAQIIVKQEPVENETENVVSSNSTNNVDSNITVQNVVNTDSPNICSSSSISSTMTPIASNSQPTIIFSTTPTKCQIKAEPQILSTISIKSEPDEFMDASSDHSGFECITLPPTPPSSNNSDSEGSLSPQRSAPSSPVRPVSVTKPIQSSNNKHITQPLFTNPIPQSGYLMLSEEEKRTLVAEGYPIPGKLPLTKQEEKNLKKIRRKIKNKISAQESRRKKKEYLEALEKRVETFTQENVDLRKRVDSLETNNRSLLGQLEKLQVLCGKMPRPSSASSTQTGTVLMVVVLSFAVFLGSWAPTSLNIGYSSPSSNADPIFYSNPRPLHPSPAMGPQLQNVRVDDYNTPSIKSRVLLSAKEDLEDLFGPDIPMKSKTEVSEFNNNNGLLKMNGSFMGKLPISWALSSFGSTLSDAKFDELNSTTTTKVSVAVNGHFYNESSSMAVNLKAAMHPHIVSAPSSDIVSFEKFGNATTEIESQ